MGGRNLDAKFLILDFRFLPLIVTVRGANQKSKIKNIPCLVSCVLCLVSFYTVAYSSTESTQDIIRTVIKTAKLKEEINLTGATLKELIGVASNLSGMKQIALKTYEMPVPPGDTEIEAISTAYETQLVGWQTILMRRDADKAVLIYGKEKDGIRERLLILLITPSQLSEMVLVGEIELSALDELRMVVLQSMPKFDIELLAMNSLRRLEGAPAEPRAETPLEKIEKMLYESGDYEKAIEMCQEIINSAPYGSDAESAQLMIGVMYGYMDQSEKQIEAFKKAGEKYPSAISHKYLGEAYQKSGMYKEAMEQYKIIMNEYPNSAESTDAYFGAGKCSEMLGMLEEAKGYYRRLTQKFQGDEQPGTKAEKELIRLERGDSRPFLGLGFSFEGIEGASIVTVFKNGPCKAAGIRPGDVLLAIDSQPTPDVRSVVRIIGWEKNIGDKVTLLIRRQGEEMEIPVTLTKTPDKLER